MSKKPVKEEQKPTQVALLCKSCWRHIVVAVAEKDIKDEALAVNIRNCECGNGYYGAGALVHRGPETQTCQLTITRHERDWYKAKHEQLKRDYEMLDAKSKAYKEGVEAAAGSHSRLSWPFMGYAR